jgi:hypothetical protein
MKHLVSEGYWVRGIDLKYPEYESSPAQEFELLDIYPTPLYSFLHGA